MRTLSTTLLLTLAIALPLYAQSPQPLTALDYFEIQQLVANGHPHAVARLPANPDPFAQGIDRSPLTSFLGHGGAA